MGNKFTRIEYSLGETYLLLESERGLEHFNFVESGNELADADACKKCHFGTEVGIRCLVAKCMSHKREDGKSGFYKLCS